jgi:hypothetical protein
VFDINGRDIKSLSAFNNPPANYTIIGITLHSPNTDKQVINRGANYRFLEGAYNDAGYPIYFERSVNPTTYRTITTTNRNIDSNLSYVVEYSLDDGVT